MSARPRALAALSAVVLIGLAVRISGQLDDLNAAHADLDQAAATSAQLRAQATAGIGPPLLDARVEAPSEALAQRLKALGFAVRQTALIAAMPAGRSLVVARLTAEGEADPTAVDRLALWAQANARSTILESLAATANADGKSQVKLELDALVRQTSAKPPLARPA